MQRLRICRIAVVLTAVFLICDDGISATAQTPTAKQAPRAHADSARRRLREADGQGDRRLHDPC